MHNNTTIVPYVSLCSGYEGIGLGLHRCIQNLRCIAYCEREAFAVANLVAKMENGLLDAAPVFTDVTTFPWEQFAPYMAGGILSFGWPCQPVSCAGKRKATEDERWLFDIIADGIALMRPGILFAENVEGLLSAKMPDGSLVFAHCIERLESLHYKVTAGIFSASEVGAPHQRKRVFIMANRRGEGVYNWNAKSEDVVSCCAWPSRPGEPQHAWEPPRVVGAGLAHTGSLRRRGRSDGDAGGLRGEIQTVGSCGGGAEAMGNAKCLRISAYREHGAMANTMRKGSSPARTEQNEECPANSAVASSGTEGMGNSDSPRPQEQPRQRGAGIQGTHADGGADADGEIKQPMGDPVDGTKFGVGLSELSGLSDSELAEICEWMVKTDNRTDELRLLGNGVVPATAERAFRVLIEELNK